MATINAVNTSPAQYAVQVGGANGTTANVTPSVTSGIPVISAGTSANPSFGTAVVAGGGTGLATLTAYAPLVGGTTSTGNVQQATTGFSTSGFVLTSTGASSLPTWQAVPSDSISITGDSGGALTGNTFIFTGGTTGLEFAGTTGPNTQTLEGTLVVANGGTGVSTIAEFGVVYGNDASPIGVVAAGTTGQVLTANTGAAPTWEDAADMFSWVHVTGTSETMVSNTGYIIDNGSLVTLTMPTNNTYGDSIEIVGKGTGGWTVVYAAGQSIKFGNVATTSTTGSLSSTNANDSIKLVCTTASATVPIFTVSAAVGNVTYV